MRLLVTGGTGVLGRALQPLAGTAGHRLHKPRRAELNLFECRDRGSHTRDRCQYCTWQPEPSRSRSSTTSTTGGRTIGCGPRLENPRRRGISHKRHCVRAADRHLRLRAGPPSLPGWVGDVPTPIVKSALAAERETARFVGRPSLHVTDAARALLAALTLPSGIYNVCRDNEGVSNNRFTSAAGWHP